MNRYPQLIEINQRGHSFQVYVNNNDEDSFWKNYRTGEWEPETLDFILSHVKYGWFLDIGSWIGPVSLLMAGKYAKVISVDFDPLAVKN